jgi:carbonic anhydrase
MKNTQKLLLLIALATISFTHTRGQCTGACKTHGESPISILVNSTTPCSKDLLTTSFPAAASEFTVAYNATKHNVILTPMGTSTNTADFHGAHYTLSEIHAHDTTEHVVDGARPSYELHLVFSLVSGTGSEKLVIGVRGYYTSSAPANGADILTTRLITSIAETGRRKCAGNIAPAKVSISLSGYKDNGFLNNYTTYCGSLTSSPYERIVTWIVCLNTVRARTSGGVNILKSGMCPNTIHDARPVQPDTVPVYRVSKK